MSVEWARRAVRLLRVGKIAHALCPTRLYHRRFCRTLPSGAAIDGGAHRNDSQPNDAMITARWRCDCRNSNRSKRATASATPPMTASRSPATSTCRRGRGRSRRWSACTAAAGRRARATPSSSGVTYLAARGYALFAISYRLAKKGQKTFPQAVQDVLAAVQFVRGSAGELKVDPERIGLFGASAGGHLASLARSAAPTSRAPIRTTRMPRSAAR